MDITVLTQEGSLEVVNKAAFVAQITAITEMYKGIVVTDKAEAKHDRAKVNKMLKAIDDKRKEAKRMYEAPFKAFEAELKELTDPLKEAGDAIDAQIKVIEEGERAERKAWIEEQYSTMPTEIPLAEVWNDAWLNLSFSKQRVLSELTLALMAAQNTPKGTLKINEAPTVITPKGVPVYDFREPNNHVLTISCTSAQYEAIEAFLNQLGVFYWEEANHE